MFQKWWREVGEPTKRSKTSRAETLKYVLGAREMRALATIRHAEEKGEPGHYITYEVEGDDSSYDMTVQNPRGRSEAGDIVG
jgi:hypothetical protein